MLLRGSTYCSLLADEAVVSSGSRILSDFGHAQARPFGMACLTKLHEGHVHADRMPG